MPDVASVLAAIDGALDDWTVSEDAMRCTGRVFPHLPPRDIETVRQVMHDTGLDGYAAWLAVADVAAQNWHDSPYAGWVRGSQTRAVSGLLGWIYAECEPIVRSFDVVSYGCMTLNRLRELEGLPEVRYGTCPGSDPTTLSPMGVYTVRDIDPDVIGFWASVILGGYVAPASGWYEATWPPDDEGSYLWQYNPGDDDRALTFTWEPAEVPAWPDAEWVTRTHGEHLTWPLVLPALATAGPFTAREVVALGAGDVIPPPPPDLGDWRSPETGPARERRSLRGQ